MDKQLIAERFAKARRSYAREARVQQQVAEKMIRLLPAGDHAYRHVVEFGCGTGCYSLLLLERLRPASLLLNDLCPEMEECVGELCVASRVRFVAGDAEQLAFPAGTDLITSCSTLQWFQDPAAFFRRCRQALPPGGILAFSTFGQENMKQIRRLTGHGLDYLSLEELRARLEPSFEILHLEEELAELSFPTPTDVLKHLKQTGVTGTEKRIWTRSRLQAFCDAYVRLFGNAQGEVGLTYHPIYVVAQVPPTSQSQSITLKETV